MASRGFASDNNAGIHPDILKAILSANVGHNIAYGDDPHTASAINKFKEHFGKNTDVYFVFTGTGANVLGLKAITEPFNSIICAETSHLNVDECGAPEKFTGCKLLAVPTRDGKITVEQINRQMRGFGDTHHAQPKAVSITQATELGTVYTEKEIRVIADFVHSKECFLHMDGARISNAAASLDASLKQITADAGVDVLSFGGTKNGMMMGEAVIFFDKGLSKNFRYIRKQGTQLASKMWFIAVQFESLLSNGLWLKNAKHANNMARQLADKIAKIPEIKLTQKTEANGVFAIVPKHWVPILQKKYFFYVWNDETSEVRLMTSFDTQEKDITSFMETIQQVRK